MSKMTRVQARSMKEARHRRESEEFIAKLELIKAHDETKFLGRKDFEPAFKYIEDMYPDLAPAVAATTIYKNTNTWFCFKKLGLPRNIGGVYMIRIRAILICHSNIPDDVVVVHEMLHFVSHMLGSQQTSTASEEDFAFGRSIPYILQQGASKEWIAKRYLLPYYTSYEADKLRDAKGQITKENIKKAEALALERAYMLIETPLGEPIENVDKIVPTEEDRFGMI